MPETRARRRKPPGPYHHGDLRHALLVETARTIREEGVDAVTLRAVGARLGVSRTALYRHFADKSALLAAVAREGFQRFRQDLTDAWMGAGRGRAGFNAMGMAYVHFALANSSHYRVMFGNFRDLCALVALQKDGHVRPDDPQELARFIWATVHGIAMLAIDGQLGPDPSAADALIRLALKRLETGIAA
jgi:AcrR family transcriptional regulator